MATWHVSGTTLAATRNAHPGSPKKDCRSVIFPVDTGHEPGYKFCIGARGHGGPGPGPGGADYVQCRGTLELSSGWCAARVNRNLWIHHGSRLPGQWSHGGSHRVASQLSLGARRWAGMGMHGNGRGTPSKGRVTPRSGVAGM